MKIVVALSVFFSATNSGSVPSQRANIDIDPTFISTKNHPEENSAKIMFVSFLIYLLLFNYTNIYLFIYFLTLVSSIILTHFSVLCLFCNYVCVSSVLFTHFRSESKQSKRSAKKSCESSIFFESDEEDIRYFEFY